MRSKGPAQDKAKGPFLRNATQGRKTYTRSLGKNSLNLALRGGKSWSSRDWMESCFSLEEEERGTREKDRKPGRVTKIHVKDI